MSITEKFKELIEAYPVQTRRSHFNNAVKPPYMVWLGPFKDNTTADDAIYFSSESYDVELYTRIDTEEEERKLEAFFDTNHWIWEKESVDWIEEDKVWMSSYSVYV